jgi:hypothetical protein
MSMQCRAALAAGMCAAALCWPPAHAADAVAGAKPGDDAMSCEQIATELTPYMQQMMPGFQTMGSQLQQQLERSRQQGEVRKKEHEAVESMSTAAAVDPTGISKRAYAAATKAQAEKELRENEAERKSPMAQKAQAQREQVMGQAAQMQADARLQRLLALGQQKGCTKR